MEAAVVRCMRTIQVEAERDGVGAGAVRVDMHPNNVVSNSKIHHKLCRDAVLLFFIQRGVTGGSSDKMVNDDE